MATHLENSVAVRENCGERPERPERLEIFKALIEVIPGQARILLSDAASRHLEATEESCFVIASEARHPEQPSRWMVHVAPCPLHVARQAEGVLLGTHSTVKLQITSKP